MLNEKFVTDVPMKVDDGKLCNIPHHHDDDCL
jgi:hypothetical protein